VEKPGQPLDPEKDITIKEPMPFVSRGGLKLSEALDSFGVSVEGKTVADIGASTGGFTDCFLQRGASKVYAVDVDTRQMDLRLREDPRVVLVEKNARYLEKKDISDSLDVAAMDLSFISVLKVLPAVFCFMEKGRVVSLIKPQFEVGRHQVGKKGIVRDLSLQEEVLKKIAGGVKDIGFYPTDVMKPSVRGQKGNQEYFILLEKLGTTPNFLRVSFSDKIKEAVWDEQN
jgi:23S rRNA (cytidine1920-2'-O)/16S rRNA (cytidine1409-2'-O)-methyltransferase